MKKSDRIDRLKLDQLKLANMPLFVAKERNLPDELEIYPGKIIMTDRIDALNYSQIIRTPFTPEDPGLELVKELFREIE